MLVCDVTKLNAVRCAVTGSQEHPGNRYPEDLPPDLCYQDLPGNARILYRSPNLTDSICYNY
jgi:hypothetical protein